MIPIYGYISCERSLVLRIGEGKVELGAGRIMSGLPGRNLCLWEDKFDALREAIDRVKKGELNEPGVLGVIIDAGSRLNLAYSVPFVVPRHEYAFIIKMLDPGRKGAGELDKKGWRVSFDTVYCPGPHEGRRKKGVWERNGRIYIRDRGQIKGYFLPQPDELFNPGLCE